MFLGLPDGTVEYGLALRETLAAQIRTYRPDIVITGNFRSTWRPGVANQADHIAVGRAALDAVRDAANRWLYTEGAPSAGAEAWRGVREVWAAGSPHSTHAVDTTSTFTVGVASLDAHRAYIEGLGWADFDPEKFLASRGRAAGDRLGTTYAAPFEVYVITDISLIS